MGMPLRTVRLGAACVGGMPVKDALVVVGFTPKAAAQEIGKVVKSAAANATNNFSQDEDALVVKRIIVNEGPTLKRGRARVRGMYFSIFKRTCHITAVVEAQEQAPRRPTRTRAAAATKAAPAKPNAESKAPEATQAETKADDVSDVAEEQRAEEAEDEATPVTPNAVEEATAAVEEEAPADDQPPAEAEPVTPDEAPAVAGEPVEAAVGA